MVTQSTCPFAEEVDKTQEIIKKCLDRIVLLEEKLQRTDKEELREELKQYREQLHSNKEQLLIMHKKHSKNNTVLLVLVPCIILSIVGITYIAINGSEF